ncbi:multidrug and toxin extrusion protein 1-like isoform X2 [Takifugu flavidus]|uniref:multidrug and toxin extrusion protein 1-like isoform X2 n=1 Tax=Takifugu flavidus TaxID=433684 RepID=UPI002544C10A|nr:multidrug and toxin extrusion protein 1-like isoform X2 [Takifugu flavidus]
MKRSECWVWLLFSAQPHSDMKDSASENSGRGVNEESESDESARSVDSCCRSWLQRRLTPAAPEDYKSETIDFLKLSGPVFMSQSMSFLIGFTSLVFCGHMGKTELAAVALAIAVINVTGISIGSGLGSACDTLISQTYGSGNLKNVGVILQRAVLILLLACFPCWALLINTQSILLAVRQSPEVARLSQLYVKIFMPALPAAFMYQLQGRYLQNQVISGAVGNVINAIINYIFLHLLDLGVAGSAGANAIAQYSLAIFLFGYIRFRGLHKATWEGWSRECMQEWGPFLKLAVPSMLMHCLEWWLYEIAGFLAGIISEVELAAQSVMYELAATAYVIPIGFSVAASVRVGNALGAGNTERAKLSSKVSLIFTLAASCLVAVCLFATKDVIGYIFTADKEILRRVEAVMKMYGLIHIAEAFAAVTGGIVRGAGKQTVGAVCNLVGFYVIGLPIGASLMFPVKMGIVGLWIGFLISVSVQAVFFTGFLYKLNWKKITEEALERAGVPTASENKDVKKSSGISPPWSVEGMQEAADAGQQMSAALTVRQLLVRRGLSLVLMIIILATAVSIAELLHA